MHYLNCKFKEEIFIPLVAIKDNIDFLCNDKDRECQTIDGIKCTAYNVKEIHIATEEAETIVKNIYNMDLLKFLRTWYKVDKKLNSMWFVRIKLKKQV